MKEAGISLMFNCPEFLMYSSCLDHDRQKRTSPQKANSTPTLPVFSAFSRYATFTGLLLADNYSIFVTDSQQRRRIKLFNLKVS